MNVFYTNGNFKAGMRLESYLPRIQGYPNRFDGTGLGMRYVGYANDFVDVTLGSFYEQFGAGLSLRAYEDRALGYDNFCLLYTSPSPRDATLSRMPSSA